MKPENCNRTASPSDLAHCGGGVPADMRFVKSFTPPDFQANNFAPFDKSHLCHRGDHDADGADDGDDALACNVYHYDGGGVT